MLKRLVRAPAAVENPHLFVVLTSEVLFVISRGGRHARCGALLHVLP